jgi:hypothetical protein
MINSKKMSTYIWAWTRPPHIHNPIGLHTAQNTKYTLAMTAWLLLLDTGKSQSLGETSQKCDILLGNTTSIKIYISAWRGERAKEKG